MKKAISQFFNVNESEKKWFRIILWWELRRIPYNLIILILGTISLYVLSYFPNDGYFKLNAGPGFVVAFYASILFFALGANLLFTLGWIVQLILKQFKHKPVRLFIKKSFIIGLIISALVTLSPILIWILNIIIGQLA